MIVFAIAGRELKSLFYSPLAWVILAIVQAILAYLFLIYLDYYVQVQPELVTATGAPGITNLVIAPLYATAATVLLLVTPFLTMRLISEEKRSQSITLLFSAPISATEIILGKYLGVLGFFSIQLLLILLMPLSLMLGGNIDFGILLSGMLGLMLLVASFSAIGLYISCLTKQPSTAAMGSFGVLTMLWIIDLATTTGEQSELFSYLSMLRHYHSMMRGIVSSNDIIYYLLLISIFLVLSIVRLDSERLQP